MTKALKIIIIISLAAVFIFIASREIEWMHKRGESYPEFSSYRSDSMGTRVFYLLLKELGFRSQRIEDELWLETECDLIFIINPGFSMAGFFDMPYKTEEAEEDEENPQHAGAPEPEDKKEKKQKERREKILTTIRSKDVQRTVRFLAEGRTIVFLTEHPSSRFLKTFGITLSSTEKDQTADILPAAHALTEDVTHISGKIEHFLEAGSEESFSPLFTANDELCGMIQTVGQGRLIVLTTPELISNDQLLQKDNLRFLLNIIEQYGGNGTIGFDEYHHGFMTSRNFTHLILKYGMELIVAHFFLLLLIFLWRSISPFGQRTARRRRLKPQYAELLSATANIYKKNTTRTNAALVFVKYILEDLEGRGQKGLMIRDDIMRILPAWIKEHLEFSPIECFEVKIEKKLSRLEWLHLIKKIHRIRKEHTHGK